MCLMFKSHAPGHFAWFSHTHAREMIEFGCHQTVVEWLDTDRFKGQDNPLDATWMSSAILFASFRKPSQPHTAKHAFIDVRRPAVRMLISRYCKEVFVQWKRSAIGLRYHRSGLSPGDAS